MFQEQIKLNGAGNRPPCLKGVSSTAKTSTEAKARWMKANYKTYRVNLRFDTDQQIIDYIELHKEHDGVTPIIRDALESLINGGQ